jgi:hypothetical protein
MKFLQLKDALVRIENIVAVGKATVPATYQSPEYYVISVWLNAFKESLNITFVDIADRDETFAFILQEIKDKE